jgi:hypothetical protein
MGRNSATCFFKKEIFAKKKESVSPCGDFSRKKDKVIYGTWHLCFVEPVN